MKRVFSSMLMVIFASSFLIFSIANRDYVTLNFWPSLYVYDAPIFSVVIVSIIFGFLWGALVTWASAGKARLNARMMRQKLNRRERELQLLLAQSKQNQHPTKFEEKLDSQTKSSAVALKNK